MVLFFCGGGCAAHGGPEGTGNAHRCRRQQRQAATQRGGERGRAPPRVLDGDAPGRPAYCTRTWDKDRGKSPSPPARRRNSGGTARPTQPPPNQPRDHCLRRDEVPPVGGTAKPRPHPPPLGNPCSDPINSLRPPEPTTRAPRGCASGQARDLAQGPQQLGKRVAKPDTTKNPR